MTGSLDDLHAAIEAKKDAVSGSSDNPERANYLTSLADTLYERFREVYSTDDLREAVNASREAMELTEDGHPDRAYRLCYFGGLLQASFEWPQLGSIYDAFEAVRLCKEAVGLSPEDPTVWGNMGHVLASISKTNPSEFPFNEAVKALQKAVALSTEEDPGWTTYSNNLASMLTELSTLSGNTDDINEAIRIAETVVERSSDEPHSSRVLYLSTLGKALCQRFECTEMPNDLTAAAEAFEKAAGLQFVSPRRRIECARLGAKLLYFQGCVGRASRLLTIAVELLSMTSPRNLRLKDAADAALAVQWEEEVSEALRELGRDILARLYPDTRGGITHLGIAHPELAEQFTDLSDESNFNSEASSNIFMSRNKIGNQKLPEGLRLRLNSTK